MPPLTFQRVMGKLPVLAKLRTAYLGADGSLSGDVGQIIHQDTVKLMKAFLVELELLESWG